MVDVRGPLPYHRNTMAQTSRFADGRRCTMGFWADRAAVGGSRAALLSHAKRQFLVDAPYSPRVLSRTGTLGSMRCMSLAFLTCAAWAVLWIGHAACGPVRPGIAQGPGGQRFIELREDNSIQKMLIDPTGRTLVVYSCCAPHGDHYVVRVFDASSLRLLWQREGHDVTMDRSGRLVAVALHRGKRWVIDVLDARTGRRRHRAYAAGPRMTFVGDRAIVIDEKPVVSVRDLATGRVRARIGYRGELLALAAGSQGRWLVVKSHTKDGLKGRRRLACGKRRVGALGSEVRVIEVRSQRTHCVLPDEYSSRVFLSPDAAYLAVGVDYKESLIVDRRLCWPRLRVTGCEGVGWRGEPPVWITAGRRGDEHAVIEVDPVRARIARRAVFHLPVRSSLVTAVAAGKALSMAIAWRTDVWGYIRVIHQRPIPLRFGKPRRWLSCHSRAAPGAPAKVPQPTAASTRKPAPPLAVEQPVLKDGLVSVRLRREPSGLILSVTNRSSDTLAIDWSRTRLLDARGQALSSRYIGQRSWSARLGTCVSASLAPGSTIVEVLTTAIRSGVGGGPSRSGRPACRSPVTVRLVVVNQAGQRFRRQVRSAGTCPGGR